MKRPLVIVFMVLLTGCASRKPLAPDPFFGRTAIPPPGTGASSAPSSQDSYYAASAGLSAMPRDHDDRAEAAPSSASWSRSEDVTPADYAVPSVSSAVASADTNSGPTSEDRAEVSGNGSSSWTIGSRDPAAIRTRINPPDYASHATHEQPVKSATHSTVEPSSPSVAAHGVSTKASPGEPERIIRVMQPLATAADRNPKEPRKTSPASEPGTSIASSSAASWHNRSAASRTTTSGGSVAPASTSSTLVAEQAPRRIILPDRVIDIMDLPDAGTPTTRQARVDRNVRPAANFATSRATSSSNVASRSTPRAGGSSSRANSGGLGTVSPRLRYGYDPDYGWLKGKLEYSQVAKRWKLRYIPIDGETDPYGGSVVLGESSLLSGQEQGNFIEVRGHLLTGENGDWGYAPIYEVAQLRPIGK